MVNKRLRPKAVLRLVRKHARQHNLEVREQPGRGKGSHYRYVVVDADMLEVGRFALTGHSRELSWTVLRSVEEALPPVFGDKWMEEQ
jgi:hypothetical protein